MSHNMPPFRGLEAFLALVQAGGIRAAARQLNISVSAVSHRLRMLEAEAGAPLFERRKNRLTLTEHGRIFHDEIEPLSQAMRSAMSRLAQSAQVRELSVSATSVVIAYWLASRIGKWREENPGIRLAIHTIDSDAVDGSDIIIRTVLGQEPGANEVRLFGWQLAPICRPDLIERYNVRTPADLARAPLIDIRNPVGGWSEWSKAADIAELRRDFVVDSHDLMMDSALQGVGFAIGTQAMMADYASLGLVMPFDISCSIPGGAYVNAPSEGESPLATQFRKWLIKQVSERPPATQGVMHSRSESGGAKA